MGKDISPKVPPRHLRGIGFPFPTGTGLKSARVVFLLSSFPLRKITKLQGGEAIRDSIGEQALRSGCHQLSLRICRHSFDTRIQLLHISAYSHFTRNSPNPRSAKIAPHHLRMVDLYFPRLAPCRLSSATATLSISRVSSEDPISKVGSCFNDSGWSVSLERAWRRRDGRSRLCSFLYLLLNFRINLPRGDQRPQSRATNGCFFLAPVSWATCSHRVAPVSQYVVVPDYRRAFSWVSYSNAT